MADTRETTKFRIPNLHAAVRAAYDLSRPQGLGHYHFKPGTLTDDEVERVIQHAALHLDRVAIRLDYVHGRAVKLTIDHDAAGPFVYDHGTWFDHSPEEWAEFKRRALDVPGLAPQPEPVTYFDPARAPARNEGFFIHPDLQEHFASDVHGGLDVDKLMNAGFEVNFEMMRLDPRVTPELLVQHRESGSVEGWEPTPPDLRHYGPGWKLVAIDELEGGAPVGPFAVFVRDQGVRHG